MTLVYFLDNGERFRLSVIVAGNLLFPVRVRRGWTVFLLVPFKEELINTSRELRVQKPSPAH